MAKEIKKKTSKTKEENTAAFEDRPELKKLLFYVVIVNFGQGDNIIRLMKSNHSSAQFVKTGEGTANKKVLDILNIEDNRKEIVYSIIREDYASELKRDIDAYFAASKKNAGIAFTIKLDAIMGVKLYKFFTQTVRG